jgi:SpoIIAA-like
MFKFIEGLSAGRDGDRIHGQGHARGLSTHAHPEAESMMTKGPIKMLYVIGKEFTGFELEALWDDSIFGIRHWHDFTHIALVTDHAWMRATASMFEPFFTAKSGWSSFPNCLLRKTGSRMRKERPHVVALKWHAN